MSNRNTPELFILGGPNGAGKTTVADFLLEEKTLLRYVNADTIAKGLDRGDQSVGGIGAGRVMLAQLRNAINDSENISFESTLSGRTWVHLIELAKSKGYEITLCFVTVRSLDICIERVKERANNGGHDISLADQKRRYPRSMKNFFTLYSKLADNWYFFDNSKQSAILVGRKENGDNLNILNRKLYRFYEERYSLQNS